MKYGRIILVLLLFFACKSSKKLITTDVVDVKKLSAKKVIKNHEANKFSSKTLDAKFKVVYANNVKGKKNKQSLQVRLLIENDSVIWLKGSKVVSAFRAKITPDLVSYYSPISKEYFIGDFLFLKELLGVEITFFQLQNLFLGQSLWDLESNSYQATIEKKAYKLIPTKQEDFYNYFLYLYPKNFKIKQQIIQDTNNKTLGIYYKDYTEIENEFLPKNIEIKVTDKYSKTTISIEVKSVEVNKKLSMPFKIPSGYKKIQLKQ